MFEDLSTRSNAICSGRSGAVQFLLPGTRLKKRRYPQKHVLQERPVSSNVNRITNLLIIFISPAKIAFFFITVNVDYETAHT